MSRTYLAVPEAFTAAECDRIVALGEAAEGEPGPVYGGDGYEVDRDRRDVRTVMLAPQPTHKFVQPEEIAELAAYLCGDFARSITGAAISIDGGWTAK